MIHMLSKFDLAPNVKISEFEYHYYRFVDEAIHTNMIASSGRIGKRIEDTPMDTDAPDAQGYYVIMSFTNREQLDNAYEFLSDRSLNRKAHEPHSGMHKIIRNPVFTCWEEQISMSPDTSKQIELVFKSERLIFKPLSEEDRELSIELWTDPELTKFVGGHSTEAELNRDHSKFMRRCAGGAVGIWTVTTLDQDQKIGTAILLPMPIEKDDTDWDLVCGDDLPIGPIEVGYIFKKSAWGKGYATEVCRRLIEFGFANTTLEEIVASTDAENYASQRVLVKSGMEYLGEQLSYGEICPFFSINRKAWSEKNA